MFHLVASANRHRYGRELAAMHAARGQVFAGRPGGGPEAAAVGAGERDRFDDERALYLMRLDSFGEIVCCVRLRPTDAGSLVSACYPQAIDPLEPSITSPRTWEFSHYYARDRAPGPAGYKLRAEMRLAVLAAALDARVERIICMTEKDRWPMILESGWNVRALGPAFSYSGGAMAKVFAASVGAQDLAAFRRRLDEELRDSVAGEDAGAGFDAVGLAGQLGPAALSVVNALSRRIAKVEQADGFEAALALVEGLERATRREPLS